MNLLLAAFPIAITGALFLFWSANVAWEWTELCRAERRLGVLAIATVFACFLGVVRLALLCCQ